jgi:acetoin utilization deacetylase AcuC-like enzyme
MEAIVVQCGADCIAGDKLGNFNLTEIGVGSCIREVLKLDLPTLFLGGGSITTSQILFIAVS